MQSEREATSKVLHYLREIDRRRLYATTHCSSLFEFCVRVLRFSESQAQRRISAARLLSEIPEIEEKLQTGALTLTNVALAQSFFRQEKVSHRSISIQEKKVFLEKLENKSTRDAERMIAVAYPNSNFLKEKARAISPTETELIFSVDQALLADLDRIKGLLAHQLPSGSYRELLREMAGIVLDKIDPLKKAAQHAAPKVSTKVAVPKRIRSAIWSRDDARCSFQDSQTGKRCNSMYGLQLDHIQPRALGGNHSEENLRLLCWGHHSRVTMEIFGEVGRKK